MIELQFTAATPQALRGVFAEAARRWNAVVDTAFAPVMVGSRRLDGLLIEVDIAPIDSAGGILGQAGPTILLPGTELPVQGIMQFDRDDVARLERDGAFADVVLHEMGHVIGVGTLWSRFGLIVDSGTLNPGFIGPSAVREYADLRDSSALAPVPIANTGGPGTREGHWRELVFGDELMTGFLSGQNRPLSRLTVAGLEDLGYAVSYDAADAYALPTFPDLAVKGIMEAVRVVDLCGMARPVPVVLGTTPADS